jgi:hypothetical protein
LSGNLQQQLQLTAQAGKATAIAHSEQAVVAYLDEAFGQDMLQEPTQELPNRQGTVGGPATLAHRIPKRHLLIDDTHNPIVAQGDPKDVRCQIA